MDKIGYTAQQNGQRASPGHTVSAKMTGDPIGVEHLGKVLEAYQKNQISASYRYIEYPGNFQNGIH